MPRAQPEDTLRRFVIRARRIEAHSLVADWQELVYHARGGFQITFQSDGSNQFLRRLPANEEEFESLAARVRPLTLPGESIYYTGVFNAIAVLLGEDRENNPEWEWIKELRKHWDQAELKSDKIQAYAVQQANIDGSDVTTFISDSQLAEAWLYTDLVHADPESDRSEVLSLSLERRYEAAVRIFSMVAVLAVRTLHLIKKLSDTGAISLPDTAWDDPVVVKKTELRNSGNVYFSAHDGDASAMPDMRHGFELGEGWSELTLTSSLRMNPANIVDVILLNESREILARYEAAVLKRTPIEGGSRWVVMVEESVVLKINLKDDGGGVMKFSGCEFALSTPTNERKARAFGFCEMAGQSKGIQLSFPGAGALILDSQGFNFGDARMLTGLRESFSDIVAIEKVRGEKFETCEGVISGESRLWLRLARLLWEGEAVQYIGNPILVTRTNGTPQPKILIMADQAIDVGGVSIPVPLAHISHPEVLITAQDSPPNSDPNEKLYKFQPPPGESLTIWSPEFFAGTMTDGEVPSFTSKWNF